MQKRPLAPTPGMPADLAPNPAALPRGLARPRGCAARLPLSLLNSQLEGGEDWEGKVEHAWLTSMTTEK